MIALLAERFLLGVLPVIGVPPLAGQVLVVAGGGIALGHYVGVKRRNRALSRPGELITDLGLYRYLRHPMYLGDLFVFLGLALLAAGPVALVCLEAGVYAVWRQARVEDCYMARRFGAVHERWAERTGLLLPRWSGVRAE